MACPKEPKNLLRFRGLSNCYVAPSIGDTQQRPLLCIVTPCRIFVCKYYVFCFLASYWVYAECYLEILYLPYIEHFREF